MDIQNAVMGTGHRYVWSLSYSSRQLHRIQYFFLIRLVGGGVQLGPLGTAATDWPTVPAPGYYNDGEFGGMK
jgi:hypothetical protein